MLLEKPFALTDGEKGIGASNAKVSEQAYAQAGHQTFHPTAMLPKSSLFQPYTAVLQTGMHRQSTSGDGPILNRQSATTIGRKSNEELTAANPPLLHKKLRRTLSLEQLEELTAEMDISSSDFINSSESLEESDFFAAHLKPLKRGSSKIKKTEQV